ncbi:RNA polymerase II transcriptional coactivator [Thrips palmi]|uniref:RNA polymerase II transcriptional coactivator n=1 Tax=Thrips palmi TaxID=161013 RepID=A0A6P8Z9I1_THRPL|nr:RNA polymerase II transcriptional coactivator [Thrips palmi]
MPPKKRSKKPASSSDSDSGPDDKGPLVKKPALSPSKPKGPKGEAGDESFPLERNRFVTVSEFRGSVMVGIREFYEKDGELLPGKKGISLTASQYQKLKDLIPQIDEALSKH